MRQIAAEQNTRGEIAGALRLAAEPPVEVGVFATPMAVANLSRGAVVRQNSMMHPGRREAMVVEDDPDARRLVSACLRRLGLVVHEVKNGAEAAKLLESLTPDLVCLDLRLPDGNGLQVCERMRASQRLHDVPVLVISALAQPSDLEAAEQVGADDFLVKPFRTAALAESVRELMARSELSPS